ncbi:MAG: Dyp-type peroxidase [Pseudomonadales bacterium]
MQQSQPRYQSGITAAASPHALFISYRALDALEQSQLEALKAVLREIPAKQQHYAQQQAAAQLHIVAALGSELWDQLSPEAKPRDLTPFKALVAGELAMPATNADLLLHIRSERHDLNYKLACELHAALSDILTLDDSVHGFRYLDSRDLTGFVDGTENPQDTHREEVAVVSDDAPFNGGSYIHTQKYRHNLEAWNAQSVKSQEDSYGRTKEENIEYAGADKHASAHTKRTSLKDAAGNSIEILRHSLPYGDLHDSGLMFASYCGNGDNFDSMLESMVTGLESGQADSILTYTQALSGDAYFAPSIDWLEQL